MAHKKASALRQSKTSNAAGGLSARARVVLGLAVSMVSISGLESFAGAATGAASVKIKSVSRGVASLTQNGPKTVISVANRTIINFSEFDLAAGQTVQFIEPSKTSVLIDRIQSVLPSQIDGTITANGTVMFLNSRGIVFGRDAVVSVPNFVAAAGTMPDSSIQLGVNDIKLTGSVTNQGTIDATHASLVGQVVSNQGTISTPSGSVVVVSGDEVLLGPASTGIFVNLKGNPGATGTATATGVTNTGRIDAGSGKVTIAAGDMYSLAMRIGGTVKANTISASSTGNVTVNGTLDASNPSPTGKGGTVAVTGKQLVLQGATVNASGTTGGGQINIGGGLHGSGTLPHAQTTYIDANSTLNASATTSGNGGQVVVWSDKATGFYGSASALGGSAGGNAGSAEVSSKGYLEYRGLVGLTAAHGLTGTLLMDPTDITLSSGSGAPVTGSFDGGSPTNTFTGNAAAATSTLFIGTGSTDTNPTLLKQLSASNVTIDTTSSGAGTGNIIVNGLISYNSTNTLSFVANNAITLNKSIVNSGPGAVSLTAKGAGTQAIMFANGSGISTGGGDITLNATAGGISTDGTAAVTISSVGTTVGIGNISVTGPVSYASSFSFSLIAGNTLTLRNSITNTGTGNVALTANGSGGSGTISFVNGAGISTGGMIQLTAVTGDIDTDGALVSSVAGSISITSKSMTKGNGAFNAGAGSVTLQCDSMVLGGGSGLIGSAGGTVLVEPLSANSGILLGNSSATELFLKISDLAAFNPAVASLTIQPTGTGSITTGADVPFVCPVIFSTTGGGGTTLTNNVFTNGQSVTFNSNLTLAATSGMVLIDTTHNSNPAGASVAVNGTVTGAGQSFQIEAGTGAGNTSSVQRAVDLSDTVSGSAGGSLAVDGGAINFNSTINTSAGPGGTPGNVSLTGSGTASTINPGSSITTGGGNVTITGAGITANDINTSPASGTPGFVSISGTTSVQDTRGTITTGGGTVGISGGSVSLDNIDTSVASGTGGKIAITGTANASVVTVTGAIKTSGGNLTFGQATAGNVTTFDVFGTVNVGAGTAAVNGQSTAGTDILNIKDTAGGNGSYTVNSTTAGALTYNNKIGTLSVAHTAGPADVFKVALANLPANTTITGLAGGTDSLVVTDSTGGNTVTITNASLTVSGAGTLNISNVSPLSVTNSSTTADTFNINLTLNAGGLTNSASVTGMGADTVNVGINDTVGSNTLEIQKGAVTFTEVNGATLATPATVSATNVGGFNVNITLNGGAGHDLVQIPLNNQPTAMTLTGGAGTDTLDLLGSTSADNITIGATTVTASSASLNYTAGGFAVFGNLEVDGQGGGDTITVNKLSLPTTVALSGPGTNTVNINLAIASAGPLTVNATGGTSNIYNLQYATIVQPVTITDSTGNGVLNVTSASAGGDAITVKGTGTGTPQSELLSFTGQSGVTFTGVGSLHITETTPGDSVDLQLKNLPPTTLSGGAGTTALTVDAAGGDTVGITGAAVTGDGTSVAYSVLSAKQLTVDVVSGGAAGTFNITSTSVPTTVKGGAGNDTMNVSFGSLSGGLTLNGGGGSDTLNFAGISGNDSFIVNAAVVSDSGVSVGYGGFALLNINTGLGTDQVTVSGLSCATTIRLGTDAPADGNDTATVNITTGAASPVVLSIIGGDGADTLFVDQSDANTTVSANLHAGNNIYNLNYNLGTIAGPVSITDGGGAGTLNVNAGAVTDSFVISHNTAAGNNQLWHTPGNPTSQTPNVTFIGIPTVTFAGVGTGGSVTVNLGGLPAGILDTGDPGAGVLVVNGAPSDTLAITGTTVVGDATTVTYANIAGLAVNGGTGSNTFNITGTSVPTTITGGAGNDTMNLTLGGIAAAVTLNGGGGTDTLNVTGSTGGDTIGIGSASITDSLVDGTATNESIAYSAFGTLNLTTLAGTDQVTITGISCNTNVTVGGGAADDDVVTVAGTGGHGALPVTVSITGGSGADTLNVNGTDTAATLIANLLAGRNVYNLDYNLGAIAGPVSITDGAGTGTLNLNAGAVSDGFVISHDTAGGNNQLWHTPGNPTSQTPNVTFTGIPTVNFAGVGTGGSVTVNLGGLPAGIFDTGASGTGTLVVNGTASDMLGVTGTTVAGDGTTITYATIGGLSVNGVSGANVFNITGTSVPTTITGSAGNDTMNVTLGGILAAITLNGGGGSDMLNVTGSTGNDTIILGSISSPNTITDSLINGTATNESLTYTGFATLNLSTFTGTDQVTIGGIECNTNVTVGSGMAADGNDLLTVLGTTGHGTSPVMVSIVGGNGADTINFDQTDSLAALFANLQGGRNVYNLNYNKGAIAGTVAITDGAGAGTLNLTGTTGGGDSVSINSTTVNFTGQGVVTYAGITSLNISEIGGNDLVHLTLQNLPVTNFTGTSTDTLQADGTGLGDTLVLSAGTITGDNSTVTYNAIGQLVVLGGPGGSTFNILSSSVPTSVTGGSGTNTMNVTLGRLAGALTLSGGTGGNNILNATGSNGTDDIVVDSTQVTDSLVNNVSAADLVKYSSFLKLNLGTLAGTDQVDVHGISITTTISMGSGAAGDGNDVANVTITAGHGPSLATTLFIYGGSGKDTLNVNQTDANTTVVADLKAGDDVYNLNYFNGTIAGLVQIADSGTGAGENNQLNFNAAAVTDNFVLKRASGWYNPGASLSATPNVAFSGVQTVNFTRVGAGGSVLVDLGGLPASVTDTGVSTAGALIVNGASGADTLGISGTAVAGDGTTVTYTTVGTLSVNGGPAGSVFNIAGTSVPTTVTGGAGNDSMTVALVGVNSPLVVNGGTGNDTLTLNATTGNILLQFADGVGSTIGSDSVSGGGAAGVTSENFGTVAVNGAAPGSVTVETTSNPTSNTNTLGLTGAGSTNTVVGSWTDATGTFGQTISTSGFASFTLATLAGTYTTSVASVGTSPTTISLGGGTNIVNFNFATVGTGPFTVGGQGGNETVNGTGFVNGTLSSGSASAGGTLNYSGLTALNLGGSGTITLNSSASGTVSTINLGSEVDSITVALSGLQGPVNLIGGGGADVLTANGAGNTTLTGTTLQQTGQGLLTYSDTGNLEVLNVVLSAGDLTAAANGGSNVNVAGPVTLEAVTGSILSGDTTPLSTGTLLLRAGNSIGSGPSQPLYTNVSTLSTAADANGVTAGQNISISNTGPVSVTALATPAALSLAAGGTVSLNPVGSKPALSGSSVSVTTTAGGINNAGGAVSIQGATITLTSAANVGSAAVPIDISNLPSNNFADTVSGSSAADGFYVNQATATGLGVGMIGSAGQTVSLTLSNGALTSVAGDLITSDTLLAFAPAGMTLGTDVATLLNLTASSTDQTAGITVVQTGAPGSSVNLQAATAGNVTASTTANLAVAGVAANNASLTAGQSITNATTAGAAGVTTGALTLSAGNSVTLNTAVTSIVATGPVVNGAATPTTGNINLTQSKAVTLTTVDSGGNFAITGAGDVTVGSVTAANGVTITTPGNVTSAAGATLPNVTAASLDVENAGSVNLATDVKSLTANLPPGATLNIAQQTDPVNLASVNVPAGTVGIQSTGGDITVTSVSTGSAGGSVTLNAGTNNLVDGGAAGAPVVTTPTLTLTANNVGLASVFNTLVQTLTLSAGSDASLSNGADLGLKSLAVGGDATIGTATGNLTVMAGSIGGPNPANLTLFAGNGGQITENDPAITAGKSITFDSPVTLSGTTTLNAPAIDFKGTLTAGANLTVTAPASATFEQAVQLKGTTTVTAGTVTFEGSVSIAGNFNVSGGAGGGVSFAGSENFGSSTVIVASPDTQFTGTVDGSGYNLQINTTAAGSGTVVLGTVSNYLSLQVGDGSNGTVSLGGNITSAAPTSSLTGAGAATYFDNPVVLTSNVAVNDQFPAGFGVIFGGAINDSKGRTDTLSVAAADPTATTTPRIYFGGNIGQQVPLKELDLNLASALTKAPKTATIFGGKVSITGGVVKLDQGGQTKDLTITAGTFTMGPNQVFVTDGSLTINATSATLDQLYAVGNLSVAVPSSGTLNLLSGSVFVGGGTVTGFDSDHPKFTQLLPLPSFADAAGSDLSSTLTNGTYNYNGFKLPSSAIKTNLTDPQAVSTELIGSIGGATPVVDLPTVIAGAVQRDIPTLTLEAGVAAGLRTKLGKLGVNLRDLSAVELLDLLQTGRGLFNDQTRKSNPNPGDYKITSDRMYSSAALQVVSTYESIFYRDLNTGAVVSTPQSAEIQAVLSSALERVVADAGARAKQPVQSTDISGLAFRSYLEKSSDPQDLAALKLLNQLRTLTSQIALLGLTTPEQKASHNILFVNITPGNWGADSDADLDNMEAAVTGKAQ